MAAWPHYQTALAELEMGVRVRTGTALSTEGEPRAEPEAFMAVEYGADLRCIAEHHLDDAEAVGSDAIASGIYLRPNGVALPVLMLPGGQAAEVLGW